MKRILILIFLLSSLGVHAQRRGVPQTQQGNSELTMDKSPAGSTSSEEDLVAKIEMYRYFTAKFDTIYIDTSLHLRQEYKHNFLRKDHFGLFAYSNEGQMYQRLTRKNEMDTDVFPRMGFAAKFFNYYQVDDMRYYHVATPYSELYFKTVMQQGQNLDALMAVNTSERLSFSAAYKGLRSLGEYVNQLSSHGNFRFTTKYESPSKKYRLKAHLTGQDLTNQQNGGIVELQEFFNNNPDFATRARFDVFTRDAQSFLKGHRFFIHHQYEMLNNSIGSLHLTHQAQHEYIMYEYKQNTLFTEPESDRFFRYGQAYVNSNLRDQTRFSLFQNKLGVSGNTKFGQSNISIDHRNFDYFYNRVLILNDGIVPNGIFENQTMLHLSHTFFWRKWFLDAEINRPLEGLSISSWKIQGSIPLTPDISFKGSILEKIEAPDFQHRLMQSNFVAYNWFNNFNNVKTRVVQAQLNYKEAWLVAQWQNINDLIFFQNNAPIAEDIRTQQILISPNQFSGQINHFSVEASKNINWRKWNLDTRVLMQQVEQSQNVFNVPEWTFRQTLAYDSYFFKKALYVQTGVTANYFSRYYADQHNPVANVFFVQQQQLIGDFPVLDFFLNAKIKTFRAFLKFEHINAGMTGHRYLIDPNQPFRDRMFRFGLTWNFFQ